MPKFVIEREIPGAGSMTQDELHKVARKSVQALRLIGPQIQWLHSYITDNKVYVIVNGGLLVLHHDRPLAGSDEK